jgi:hypothetical protein
MIENNLTNIDTFQGVGIFIEQWASIFPFVIGFIAITGLGMAVAYALKFAFGNPPIEEEKEISEEITIKKPKRHKQTYLEYAKERLEAQALMHRF